ncbi:hypothetical protein PVAP13_1NG417276 [Panicum virgatum]|uniref:Uncharacterized protein n=1 Tax=Panicum virgatum TaxID=38727 RepID=A0A8T0X343_PANVG|nr:hypothetical protein PVAP13_1NG417276 [Panicum virgatum]
MAMARKPLVLPLLMAVVMLLVVSGAAACRLDGDRWAADEAAFSGVGGHHRITQFLKRLYLQQLSGPCHNDVTSDPSSPQTCRGPP